MSKLLTFALRLEIVSGSLLALTVLAASNKDWGVIGAYLLFVAVNGVLILIAVWRG